MTDDWLEDRPPMPAATRVVDWSPADTEPAGGPALTGHRVLEASLRAAAPQAARELALRRRRIFMPALQAIMDRTDDRHRWLEEVNHAMAGRGLPTFGTWQEVEAELRKPLPEPEPVPAYETVPPPQPPEPIEEPGAREPAARHRRRQHLAEQWRYLWMSSHGRYPLQAAELDEEGLRARRRVLDLVNMRRGDDPLASPELLDEDLAALGHSWVAPPSPNAVDFDPAEFDAARDPGDPVEAALDEWERRTRLI